MPVPRHGWILDGPRDLLFLIGTPLLVLPLLMAARATWSDMAIAGVVLAFGATGHHLPGLLRAYGDRDLFERFRARFIFGPVLLFGRGGTAVEVIGDRAIGFPPLNMNLARELVSRTRVSRRLEGYRGRAPADREAICLALVQLVCPDSRPVDSFLPLVELLEILIEAVVASEGDLLITLREHLYPTATAGGLVPCPGGCRGEGPADERCRHDCNFAPGVDAPPEPAE